MSSSPWYCHTSHHWLFLPTSSSSKLASKHSCPNTPLLIHVPELFSSSRLIVLFVERITQTLKTTYLPVSLPIVQYQYTDIAKISFRAHDLPHEVYSGYPALSNHVDSVSDRNVGVLATVLSPSTRFFSRCIFHGCASLRSSPFLSISTISLPPTPHHPTSFSRLDSIFHLNPDTPISTTSSILSPPRHFTCRTRQSKRSTPHPLLHPPLPLFLAYLLPLLLLIRKPRTPLPPLPQMHHVRHPFFFLYLYRSHLNAHVTLFLQECALRMLLLLTFFPILQLFPLFSCRIPRVLVLFLWHLYIPVLPTNCFIMAFAVSPIQCSSSFLRHRYSPFDLIAALTESCTTPFALHPFTLYITILSYSIRKLLALNTFCPNN